MLLIFHIIPENLEEALGMLWVLLSIVMPFSIVYNRSSIIENNFLIDIKLCKNVEEKLKLRKDAQKDYTLTIIYSNLVYIILFILALFFFKDVPVLKYITVGSFFFVNLCIYNIFKYKVSLLTFNKFKKDNFYLFLRGFKQDEIVLHAEDLQWEDEFKDSFEKEYLKNVKLINDFYAIGKPEELYSPNGARRIYVDEIDWEPQVLELIKRAKLIIILVYPSNSCKIEISKSLQFKEKTIFFFRTKNELDFLIDCILNCIGNCTINNSEILKLEKAFGLDVFKFLDFVAYYNGEEFIIKDIKNEKGIYNFILNFTRKTFLSKIYLKFKRRISNLSTTKRLFIIVFFITDLFLMYQFYTEPHNVNKEFSPMEDFLISISLASFISFIIAFIITGSFVKTKDEILKHFYGIT